MQQPSPFSKLSSRSAALAALLVAASSCAGPQVKGPHIQVCFIEAEKGGIECAMENNKQVFLRWDQIKAGFLAGFDKQVLVTREGFNKLLAWGHRK